MALTVPIVFTVIMGCLELGMAFNGYVTITAAAREGARAGSIYLYDSSYSQSANDQNREAGTGTATPYTDNARDTVAASLGILKNSSPYFDKNSDVTISYTPTSGSTLTRRGDVVSVQVKYHYTPLSQFFGSGSTITMTGQASGIIE